MTSSGQECQFQIATDMAIEFQFQEWQFHIVTDF